MTPHAQRSDLAHTITDKNTEQEMLRSALKLEQWYFVGAEDGSEPVIGMVDGKPHLLAFTERACAEELAQRRASRQNFAASTPPIIAMAVAEVVSLCKRLMTGGLAGVLLTSGNKAVRAGLQHVLEAHRHQVKHGGGGGAAPSSPQASPPRPPSPPRPS